MKQRQFHYIYGPVWSWRLGASLGIDALARDRKVCNFDCIYCQIGKTVKTSNRRAIYVPSNRIISEIKKLPKVPFDYITFSGKGEPTLAKNLGELICRVRALRKEKIAVITNAATLSDRRVVAALQMADVVVAKLDACSQASLERINRPERQLRFQNILNGIIGFRKGFRGKFALQLMFTKENARYAHRLARLAAMIAPDEVQINTPLRPCGVTPLSRAEVSRIKKYFKGYTLKAVYDKPKKTLAAFDEERVYQRRGSL